LKTHRKVLDSIEEDIDRHDDTLEKKKVVNALTERLNAFE